MVSQSICHEAVVADMHEARGEDVKQEPANELAGVQCHLSLAVAVSIVLPLEGNFTVIE